MEKYNRLHKNRNSKRVPSTFADVFPLKPLREPEEKLEQPPPPAPGLTAPQHHQIYTPRAESPGPTTTLRDVDFPLPSFQAPTRKEERTIAQKNQDLANAKENMRYLGWHLVVSTQAEVVVSSTNITKPANGSTQRDPSEATETENSVSILQNRAVSEPGTGTNWERDGRLWSKRNSSDPGLDMPDIPQEEITHLGYFVLSWTAGRWRATVHSILTCSLDEVTLGVGHFDFYGMWYRNLLWIYEIVLYIVIRCFWYCMALPSLHKDILYCIYSFGQKLVSRQSALVLLWIP